MRAFLPAAMAWIAVVFLMILTADHPAQAIAPNAPVATATVPPRASSLPGADETPQVNNTAILAAATIVLVGGGAGIVFLLRRRM